MKKKYLVTLAYEEHYLIEAEDEVEVEEIITRGEVEPYGEDTPLMYITENIVLH